VSDRTARFPVRLLRAARLIVPSSFMASAVGEWTLWNGAAAILQGMSHGCILFASSASSRRCLRAIDLCLPIVRPSDSTILGRVLQKPYRLRGWIGAMATSNRSRPNRRGVPPRCSSGFVACKSEESGETSLLRSPSRQRLPVTRASRGSRRRGTRQRLGFQRTMSYHIGWPSFKGE
jgi:hypothetical protein